MKLKTKSILVAITIIALVIFVYFRWFAPSKAVNFILPDINELSYVNAKIESDTAHIEIVGILHNKAPYRISIDSLTYNIELAGVTLVAEHKPLHIEQKSGDKDTVMLTFRLPISKTRNLIQKLQGKDSTDITLNLDVTYNTFFGKATIPFTKIFDINVPTPPEITLNKVKAGELNLKQKHIDLALAVSIKNNSETIELRLSDLTYDAKIGNNIKGSGRYNQEIVIKPLASTNLSIPINVQIDKPFQVFWNVVTNEDLMNYEINLDGLMQTKTPKKLPISITATGTTQLIK